MTPTVTAAHPPARMSEVGPPEQAWLRDHGELIVGSMQGLIAYSITGIDRRTISAGPALYPRWYGHDSALIVRPWAAPQSSALERGATLEQISLWDGTRRELLALPPVGCGQSAAADATPGAEQPHFDLEDPSDFVVDAQRGVACLQLMDAGWNMASMRMELQLDLAARRVARFVTIGLEDCALPQDVQRGAPASAGFCPVAREAARAEQDPTAFAFSFSDEYIRNQNGAALVRIPYYEVERSSQTGRWLLLAGDLREADFVYRRLLLMDRQSAQLFAIPEHARPWPFPLRPPTPAEAGAPAVLPTPVESAALRRAEADIRFLGDGRGGDLLVIDDLVIVPGRSMFDVDAGSIAR